MTIVQAQDSTRSRQDIVHGGRSGRQYVLPVAIERVEVSTSIRDRQRLVGSLLLVSTDVVAVAAVLTLALLGSELLRTTAARPISAPGQLVQQATEAAPDRMSSGAVLHLSPGLLLFAVLGLGLIAMLSEKGHYRWPIPPMTAMRQIFAASAYGSVASLFFLCFADAPTSARCLPAAWLVVPLAISILRGPTIPLLRRCGFWQQRSLIAYSAHGFHHVNNALRADRSSGYDIVGSMALEKLLERVHDSTNGRRPEASATPLRELLDEHGADSLVLSFRGADPEIRAAVLKVLAYDTIPYSVVTDLGGLPVSGCELHYFMSHSAMIMTYKDNLAHPVQRTLKSTFDRSSAFILTLIVLPMLMIVGLLVALDGGPVVFRHRRLGKDGQPFGCMKFRTMVVNADEILAKTLAEDSKAAAEWAQNRKLRHDPRVTRIGRLLRKTSLDELPQLLNVIRGEMSLVGPRPIVNAEIVRYGRDIEFYYRVKPGITGLWQVSGRSDTSYHKRVQLDVWYVKNWSLWHDLAILFRTVPALLKREGSF